ncbi:hypothetical protein LJC09_01600 [Desulfovibrio sp. OttesenSCG-928-F20]|nr:hypothetical protein [Desulfovibrio sp. OttesenSCG-928-F20]
MVAVQSTRQLSGRFNVRVTQSAVVDGVSLNTWVNRTLEKAVSEHPV